MDAKLFVRQAFPGRESLATAGDRIEGAVLVVVVAVVLPEDAPPVSGFVVPDGPVESALVFATWRGPDGKQRQGAGHKAGGIVTASPPGWR